MNLTNWRLPFLIGSILVFELTSCNVQPTPFETAQVSPNVATTASLTAVNERTSTSSPSPTNQPAYPGPGIVSSPPGTPPYPAPGSVAPPITANPGNAYPAPGSGGTPQPTATGVQSAYPGPGVVPPTLPLPTGGPGAYPPPNTSPVSQPTATLSQAANLTPSLTASSVPASGGTSTPTAIATVPVEPTVTPQPTFTSPPTETEQPTLTPTPTAISLRTDLEATDPKTVKLASGKVQLVEFFAFWCGTCRAMAPILNELEAEYASQVNFIYLDIDDPATADFKSELHFRLQPHFFLLDRDGKVLKQWQDFVSADEFKVYIDDALN